MQTPATHRKLGQSSNEQSAISNSNNTSKILKPHHHNSLPSQLLNALRQAQHPPHCLLPTSYRSFGNEANGSKYSYTLSTFPFPFTAGATKVDTPVFRSYVLYEEARRFPPPPGRSTTNCGMRKPAILPRSWHSRSRMVWRGVRRSSTPLTMSPA